MDRSLASALLIAAAYLLGSIPTAYLAGRWLSGRDLRRYGSGTVSGSMVYEHVAKWAVVPVGLFDIGKTILPAWLAQQLGLGVLIVVSAGLGGVIGHNWPLFLGFHGGRGLGNFLGLLLVLFPWGVPWLLGFLFLGWLLGDSAPFAMVGLITVPLLSYVIGGPAAVLPATTAMVLITLAKRVEANRRPLPTPGPERWQVVLWRLFFDRDIADHKAWIRRTPDHHTPRSADD